MPLGLEGAPKLKRPRRSPCPASSSTQTDTQEQLCQWVCFLPSGEMNVCFRNQVVAVPWYPACGHSSFLQNSLLSGVTNGSFLNLWFTDASRGVTPLASLCRSSAEMNRDARR